jgi:uncharacterized protein
VRPALCGWLYLPSEPRLIQAEQNLEGAASCARLPTLDLIRGVAVLGILAINIAGFAGPMVGTLRPSVAPFEGTSPELLDKVAWSFGFLLFEGKMRALFTLLFGAGLVLFSQRADAAGRDGDSLQLRRLGWLLIFGMAHYLLLWWGDILFLYAACGIVALTMRSIGDRPLLWMALALYCGYHAWGFVSAIPTLQAEEAARTASASPAQARLLASHVEPIRAWAALELREAQFGFLELVGTKLIERPFWQVQMVASSYAETLPLILIGMVLFRRGFFDGRLPRARLRALAWGCTLAGLLLTGLYLAWAWPRGFPLMAMQAAFAWGMALPHLLGGIGYAAVLVLATPALARSGLGRTLAAAGRMAFSNYILTSLVMTALFYGWGLGLHGRVSPAEQWLFVAGGWALMLVWSSLWLRLFRRGPLEWLWRSLVERRPLNNRTG